MRGDRRHGPPRRLGQTAQQGDASPEVLQPDPEGVPGIAKAGRAADGRSRVTAHPERHLVRRLGRAHRVGQVVVLAVEGGLGLVPQRAQHGDGLIGHGATVREVRTEHAELLLQPTDAHPEDEASTREHIQRSNLLGDQNGVALGQHQGRGAQGQARHQCGDRGQSDQRFDDMAHAGLIGRGDDVVVGPQGGVAQRVGRLRGRGDRLWEGPGPMAGPVSGQECPDLHGAVSLCHACRSSRWTTSCARCG